MDLEDDQVLAQCLTVEEAKGFDLFGARAPALEDRAVVGSKAGRGPGENRHRENQLNDDGQQSDLTDKAHDRSGPPDPVNPFIEVETLSCAVGRLQL